MTDKGTFGALYCKLVRPGQRHRETENDWENLLWSKL